MDIFEQILALTEDRTVRMVLALAAVLLLILVVAAIYRRIARRGPSTKRGRVARLAILEAIPVDQRRRLILLRRDNTEHLVMIGGPTDLVVEEGIHRQARQPANKRPAPERTLPDRAAPESSVPEHSSPERTAAEPAAVPRIPIGARTSDPAATPKPVSSTPDISHSPAPAPAVTPSASPAPIAPISPVVPAAVAATAVAATSILSATDSAPSTAPPEPETAPPVETVEAATEVDPQVAEMERKLQDALKAPTPDEPCAPAQEETTGDLELPDLESSLEAAIADAVANEAVSPSPDANNESDTSTLTERLESISSGKSPSG